MPPAPDTVAATAGPAPRKRLAAWAAWTALGASSVLLGCGGGGSSVAEAPPPPPPPPTSPTDAQRTAAASATANNNARCRDGLGGFYWEIGDASGRKASGSVGSDAPSATAPLQVFSASKWMYAAQIAEKRGAAGLNGSTDLPFLRFTSGHSAYGNLPVCTTASTESASVADCRPGADTLVSTDAGRFAYDSGHMQWHAISTMGWATRDNAALAQDLNATLGLSGLEYRRPIPAAGVVASADTYAQFLRKVLRGELRLLSLLGTSQVCANPRFAGCNAGASPADASTEGWNYSVGHWVEADPTIGDGAFSSPGGGGFYPWIDRTRTTYGILAREVLPVLPGQQDAGFRSAECGRLIRQAWRTGSEVVSTIPTP